MPLTIKAPTNTYAALGESEIDQDLRPQVALKKVSREMSGSQECTGMAQVVDLEEEIDAESAEILADEATMKRLAEAEEDIRLGRTIRGSDLRRRRG